MAKWQTTITTESSLPEVPKRRTLLLKAAIESTDPMMKQAVERLLVTAELVHGEEVAKTIRDAEAKRAEMIEHRQKMELERLEWWKKLMDEMETDDESKNKPSIFRRLFGKTDAGR